MTLLGRGLLTALEGRGGLVIPFIQEETEAQRNDTVEHMVADRASQAVRQLPKTTGLRPGKCLLF